MENRVTKMNANDEITIRTQFSDYSFRVTDADECRGVLTGGMLGTVLHEAMLVNAIHPKNRQTDAFQLEPGDRAVFLVGSNTITKLTTSTITEIVLPEATEATAGDC